MTESLDLFTIDSKAIPWKAISGKPGFLKKIYSAYCSRVLKKMILPQKGVPNSVLTNDHAGVGRSEEYFRYRTFSKTFVVRVKGALIWLSTRNALLIGDMQGVDEKNFSDVINSLKKLAKRLGLKQVQFHVSPGTILHQLFSGTSGPTPSFPALFQDFGSPVPPEKIKFTYADMDSF